MEVSSKVVVIGVQIMMSMDVIMMMRIGGRGGEMPSEQAGTVQQRAGTPPPPPRCQ